MFQLYIKLPEDYIRQCDDAIERRPEHILPKLKKKPTLYKFQETKTKEQLLIQMLWRGYIKNGTDLLLMAI